MEKSTKESNYFPLCDVGMALYLGNSSNAREDSMSMHSVLSTDRIYVPRSTIPQLDERVLNKLRIAVGNSNELVNLQGTKQGTSYSVLGDIEVRGVICEPCTIPMLSTCSHRDRNQLWYLHR